MIKTTGSTCVRKDGAICRVVDVAHARHEPPLPPLVAIKVWAHVHRAARDDIEVIFAAVVYIDEAVRVILSP